MKSVCTWLCVFPESQVYFWGFREMQCELWEGNREMVGAKFPLEKQSVCNYIHADCARRKCVPRIRSLDDVAPSRCARVFVSHLFYR